MTARPMRSLILCTVPRSGSTLLCDLLAATGVGGRPESWFRPGSISGFAKTFGVAAEGRAYIDAAIRAGCDGTGTFGLRLMCDHREEALRRLRANSDAKHADAALFRDAFGPANYVFLTRRDGVAQAVSRLRAERSGLWHRNADGSVREQTAERGGMEYDRNDITRYLAEAQADKAPTR